MIESVNKSIIQGRRTDRVPSGLRVTARDMFGLISAGVIAREKLVSQGISHTSQPWQLIGTEVIPCRWTSGSGLCLVDPCAADASREE